MVVGAKKWVSVIYEKLLKRGGRDRAIAFCQRWRHRFYNLKKKGLLRNWDEVELSRKSKAPGIILPVASRSRYPKPKSDFIRKGLAKGSEAQRLVNVYGDIRRGRSKSILQRLRQLVRLRFSSFGRKAVSNVGSCGPLRE
jgi:hypothetical protein